ncbi:MFS transporter [Streptomyces sioyaensis]|uniref:MFS transporter n=1 Tax=Streptomyces sioyaensis TaxID=67364 RepID=A0A4Q1QTT0_9ACTN|nr:MFS transporter [Streptomyces sioyaensis]MBM4791293.1 MFS transporter [Streptomyces sioyaensis]RXS65186.1 MFS transporter [Streptomyces sioyaensis]
MSLLRDRNFLLLFVGQGVSRFGDGLYTAATAWLAWSLTKDPAAVALVSVSAFAPAFVATFVGASYADRYDRRKLMVATDLARVAVLAAALALMSLGLLDLPLLVAGTALLALIGAPFAPARNAIVPQIVPAGRLQQANGLLQVAFRATFFVGPLMLAPLLTYGSLQLALVINGLTFVVSAGAVAAIRVARPASTGGRVGLWSDLAAGLRAVRAAPDVLVVIVTFVLALALTSGFLTVGLVAVVGKGSQYGLLLGTSGVAEVVGALLIAGLRIRRPALAAVLAWALLGIFRAPLGTVNSGAVAAFLLIATGLASALTDIPLIALVQQRIPERHLAKALGLWEAGIAGALAVSPFVASTAITLAGVEVAFLLSGAVLVVLAATAALTLARVSARQSLRRLNGTAGKEAGQGAVAHKEGDGLPAHL